MSALRLLLAGALLAAAAGPAPAIDADEMLADPAQEARAREIGRELRCLVCRNQSIFDSNAGLAKDLRVAVRERIVAGDTDEEALAWIAERYGAYVLLEPPVTPTTWVLWAAPWAALALALGGGAAMLRRRRAAAPPAALDADEAARARALLEDEA